MYGTGLIACAAIGKLAIQGLTMSVAGGAALEGASLVATRALKEHNTTAAKVARCGLAAMAVLGACAATAGIGASAFLATYGLTAFLASESVALPVGCAAAAVVAFKTLSIHRKAFHWSGV